ncbi:MAG TPA: MBG domain-containing protein, partial [Roseiflexaceae bacterium]|nr:MBG domain-containing protein [Roseiflexaceae bacterium]
GNRSWSYFDRDQRREADYINDEFARRSWLDMGNLAPHGTYVHVYLNGLYWGLYNVTENLDSSFLSSYTGQPAASFDIVQAGDDTPNLPVASAGTANAWNEVVSLLAGTAPVSDVLYNDIATRVDVANLADYMIHAHYIGKTDWPEQYWNAYRSNTGPDTRFKFMPLDNDTGLNKVTENTTLITDTVGPADSPDSVFRRLLTNNEFRQVLADRFYKHVVSPTGALATTACNTRYNDLATLIDQAVIAESARWGDYMRDKYPPSNNAPKAFPAYIHSRDLPDAVTNSTGTVTNTNDIKTWVEVRDSKLGTYCTSRDNNVTTQYVTNTWYSNTLLPPTISQAGGMINAGSNVTLTNSNGSTGEIYYTTDGSDPRAPLGGIGVAAILGNDSVSFPINAITTVKARIYNAGAWSPLLEHTFYIQQAFNNLEINEIHYAPVAPLAPAGLNPNDYEFVELHNRGGSSIQLQGVTFTNGIFYQFGAGSIPAGGYIVLASNATRFQERYGFAPDGVYTGNLLNSGETLELSNPAGTPFDTVTFNKVGEPWPGAANAGGGSLSLTIGASNNAVATSWFASQINGGTPKAANDSTMGKQTPVIVTANPAPAITYGAPLQLTATAQTSGGQAIAGTFTFNPPLGTVLNAGANQPVQVIFEPSDSISYNGVNTTVTITVNPAPLTVTAVNKVKAVGAPNPVLEASYSGFVNGDTAASLDVAPVLTTTAVQNSPIGDYPITVSSASDPNYSITYVGGILTVTNKVIPVITWANPAPIVYGTPLGAGQLNATATANGQPVAGTFTYTPAAGTVLQAGNSQMLSVVFTPTDTTTYVEVNASTTIDVAKAPLMIKADNKIKLVGTANPPLTATYTGFVNGDTVNNLDSPAILSTTAQTNSPVGIYPITVSGASDANYDVTFVNGSMTVATEITNPPGQYNIYLPLVMN